MGYRYIVCDLCGHIETLPEAADEPAKCENCKHPSLWAFSNLNAAEVHSERIIGNAMRS